MFQDSRVGRAKRQLDLVADPAAFTVDSFCLAHGISRGLFYKLQRAGKGPRIMRIGSRVTISREAAAEFRRNSEETE